MAKVRAERERDLIMTGAWDALKRGLSSTQGCVCAQNVYISIGSESARSSTKPLTIKRPELRVLDWRVWSIQKHTAAISDAAARPVREQRNAARPKRSAAAQASNGVSEWSIRIELHFGAAAQASRQRRVCRGVLAAGAG